MFRKLKPGTMITGAACVLALVGAIGFSGCSQKTLTDVVPFVPPSYYSSTFILPFDLSNAYWSAYITRTQAEKNYDGQT
jgi:hypothetical protein